MFGGENMEVDVISQLIGNVGFPIAAFALMWWMCNDTLKGVQNALNDLTKTIEVLKDDMKVG